MGWLFIIVVWDFGCWIRDYGCCLLFGIGLAENQWLEFCVSETSVFFDFPDFFYGIDGFYPLVNVYIAMERSTIFNGKIHYFDHHFQ